MFELRSVSKSYGRAVVAKDLDLSLGNDRIVGLVGPSGCGKSSLGRVLLGLEQPNAGVVLFKDRDIHRLDRRDRMDFRRAAQMVPQHPDAAFNPRLLLGTSLREVFRFHDLCPKADQEEYLAATLEHVSLHPELLRRYPSQLSGGELQRLAIARSILTKPSLLVLDEVTSMLDVSIQASIIRTLQHLHHEHAATYLFITHDLDLAQVFCHEILELSQGRLKPLDLQPL